MKCKIILLLTFLITRLFLDAQNSGLRNSLRYYIDVVFEDGANIRSKPSINSEIIGKLKHNSLIERDFSIRMQNDTINAKQGHWFAIKYNNETAYIWNKTLAIAKFNTYLDIQKTFLLNFDSDNVLKFKLFQVNDLVYEKQFQMDVNISISGAYSFGILPNTNGKEIIVVITNGLSDSNKNYKLYEWDGYEIKVSDYKLKDDSFITGNYKKINHIINADNVIMRKEPSIDAEKISTFSKNTFVELVAEDSIRKQERLNGEWGKWLYLKKGNKKGFVWSEFVSIPHQYIESNYSEHTFLTTSHGVYVLENEQVIKHYPEIWCRGDDIFYEKGNLGLEADLNILAINYFGGSCGKYSGEMLWAWNGKDLIPFGNNGGVGDGGLSDSYTKSFPITNGLENTIFSSTSYGESLQSPFGLEYGDYGLVTYSEETKKLQYNGDTLVEVASIYKTLKDKIEEEFPSHTLLKYIFGKINKDSYQDVLFIITPINSNETEKYQQYSMPRKPKAVIAYGNNQGKFDIQEYNTDIFEFDYIAIDIKIENFIVSLSVFYNMGYDSDSYDNAIVNKFDFYFDETDDNIYWKSKSIGNQEGDRWNDKWSVETSHFKKNKIHFKDAWSIPKEEEY